MSMWQINRYYYKDKHKDIRQRHRQRQSQRWRQRQIQRQQLEDHGDSCLKMWMEVRRNSLSTKGQPDFEYDFLTDRLFLKIWKCPFSESFSSFWDCGSVLMAGWRYTSTSFFFSLYLPGLVRPRPSIFSLSIELKAESFLQIFCKDSNYLDQWYIL